MNPRDWIDQRRDAAIDAALGHLAPATAGLALGWVATAMSEPAIWSPGFALIAMGLAQCIVRIRVRTVLLSQNSRSSNLRQHDS